MRSYQLILVLKSSLNEAARKKYVETVKGWLKDAKFTKEEDWGEKVLAYTIKRETSGHYLNFLIELKEELSADFAKKIVASDNILRHLLLKSK
jgi:small subunit ribosomal protein S6